MAPPDIDPKRIPRHVACVMDGNGRWARQRGLKRTEGHAAGEDALFDTVEGGLELGLDHFSVYAFSTENWKRPTDEVRYLMGFNEGILIRHTDELDEKGVRIRFLGRRDWRVPRRILRRIDEATEQTKRNRTMTFNVCFNYGGRAEIVDAVRHIAQAAKDGEINPAKIDERTIRQHLYEPDLPDVDLFIRTSGEQRTSNFLLWQAAYAELMFVDTPWPDFDRRDLWAACVGYAQRNRRFGAAGPIEAP